MNSNGFAHVGLVVLIILVLGAVGGAGWYVWTSQQEDSTSTKTSQKDTEVKTQEKADDPRYAGWKEYSSDKWGFSFKYPTDWTARTTNYTDVESEESATHQMSTTLIGPKDSQHDFLSVEVLDISLSDIDTNDYYKDSALLAYPPKQPIKLGSYNGYKYTTSQDKTATYFYQVGDKLIVFDDTFGTQYKTAEAKLILESFSIK